jgi:putative RecB family exonuclease
MEIHALRKQAHLSASGISDYLECGLLYKFSRIDKQQPEGYADSLMLGKAIHAVLAGFYKELKAGTRMSPKYLEEALDHHREQMA